MQQQKVQPQTVKDYSRIKLSDIVTNQTNSDLVVIYRDGNGQIHFATDCESLATVIGELHLMQKLIEDMSLFPEDYQEQVNDS